MKKRYSFLSENWFQFGLTAILSASLAFSTHAQTPAPTKQWDKTIGGDLDDNLSAIFQTADGGYILTGDSKSGISGEKSEACKGDFDYWVVKLDAAGNKIWDKTLGTWTVDYVNTVVQAPDGGYLVGGFSYSTSSDRSQPTYGDRDFWLVKLDAAGNKVWNKS